MTAGKSFDAAKIRATRFRRGMAAGWSAVITLGFSALPCRTGLAVEKVWDGTGRSNQWTENANWSGIGGAPDPGDDLRFPAGSFEFNTSNDFAGGTAFNKITWSGAGYTAGGNQVDLGAGIVVSHATGTTVVNLPISLAGIQTFDVTQAGASLTLNGAVNLGSRSLTITGAGNTTVAGAMSGFLNLGSVRKTGTGTLTISGAPSYTGNTTVDGGTLSVSGSLPNSTVIVNNGGTLRGTGPVDGITANSGGTVRPGTSSFFASDLVSTDNVALHAGSNLVIGLNGAGHGVGYGGLDVTGTVTLGGTLTVSTAFTPEVGKMFTIISNDGTDEVTGTFTGLPDGAQFTVSGRPYRIFYGRGFGLARLNDVIIEAVPELKIWDGGGGVNNLWTEPTNWDDDTAPLPGDDIQIAHSSMTTTLTTINDFPGGHVFGSLIFAGGSIKVDGNTATIEGDIHDTAAARAVLNLPMGLKGGISLSEGTTVTCNGPVVCSADQTFRVGHNADRITTTNVLSLDGYDLTFDQPLTSGSSMYIPTLIESGNLIKTGAGPITLGTTPPGMNLMVNGGRVIAGDLTGPVFVNAGGTLDAWSVVDMTVNGGTVEPVGGAPGTIYWGTLVHGIANLNAGGVLHARIYSMLLEGGNPDSRDAVCPPLYPINGGLANLASPALNITISPDAEPYIQPGDAFLIVAASSGGFSGTFAGLPEGARIIAGNHSFTVTYQHGQYEEVALIADLPFVWDGGAFGNLWTTPGNWEWNIAPFAGQSFTFPPGVSETSVNNDFPPETTFRSLNLTGSGYALSGNSLRLNGGISQPAAATTNTVSNDLVLMALSGASTSQVQVDGAGRLILEGAISGSAARVKTGTGVLRLAGTSNNSGGSWSVLGGELELDKSGATAVTNSLTIGNGTDPAVVSLLGNHQIPDTLSVTVNEQGKFDVGTSLDEIGILNGAGKVELGRGFTAGRLSVNSGTFSGFIGGTGFLTKTGAGTLTLAGTSAYSGRTIADEGTLSIDGGHVASEVLLNGGTLRGIGYAGIITGNTGGVLHPGNATPGPYVMLKSKDVALNPATTFLANISGTNPGVETQKLDVTGTVNLGGCALGVSLLFNPIASAGRNFTIIENDGTDPVQGTFAGLPEGATFQRDGMRWQVSYTGGSGNDVVLTLLELLPPVISSSQLTTNGNLTSVGITGIAPERTTCDLESSPNLVTWAVVRTMTATADGTFSFSYYPPAATRRLCFRVRVR